MLSDAADHSASSAANSGGSGRALQTSRSFNKLKFGREKHKASAASTCSTSTSSSLQTALSVGSEDDGGEEISWHIQSASSTPKTPVVDGMLRDLVIISTIGTGSFGRVKLVRSSADGRFYALKVLRKTDLLRLKQVQHVLDEKKLLLEVRHPFIVTLYGTFKDEHRLYMLMDYVSGGELFKHLRSAGCFPTATARFYIACVISAIEHLHSHDIVYRRVHRHDATQECRDLKPENILLTRSGYIKIADFGFAKKVTERTWTLCGTPEYLAPEIIQNRGHGKPVDWWAVGILLFEMLAGFPPFYDDNPFLIYQRVLSGRMDFPFHMDRDAKDLIQRLCHPDRNQRLGCTAAGAAAVRAHPFLGPIDWTSLTAGRVKPPFTPRVASQGDTSNFDQYPASIEGTDRSAMLLPRQADDAFREF